jgi:hypothetical protein
VVQSLSSSHNHLKNFNIYPGDIMLTFHLLSQLILGILAVVGFKGFDLRHILPLSTRVETGITRCNVMLSMMNHCGGSFSQPTESNMDVLLHDESGGVLHINTTSDPVFFSVLATSFPITPRAYSTP